MDPFGNRNLNAIQLQMVAKSSSKTLNSMFAKILAVEELDDFCALLRIFWASFLLAILQKTKIMQSFQGSKKSDSGVSVGYKII